MSASFWIAFWLALFVGTHMTLSALPVRQRLVAKLGDKTFLGLYSLIAFGTFVPLVSVYLGHRHAGELLWNVVAAPGVRPIAMVLAVLGIAIVVAAELNPSPAQVGVRRARGSRGLTRITRHPLFMGIALWACSHLLLHGYATDALFFGGLLVFSLLGAWHQDVRKLATERERLGPFLAETSFWPFAAILAGRNRLIWRELPWIGLLIGAAVAIGIYALHPWMFHAS